ncbi:MAG: YdcF family protein [Acetobacteraceae bacterium]|nr:YdcF family protein [Acetobacteraceae bacterium]
MTALLLPPLVLLPLAAWLAWRGAWRASAMALAAVLVLATPMAEGALRHSLAEAGPPGADATPEAIVILAAGLAERAPDALTLERLRAGASLHRRTQLPVLVTGGTVARDAPPAAQVMARSLAEDFAVPVRWIESRARDTRENAALATAMLRAEGVPAAFVVTHAWHMARAREAFARAGMPTRAAPVRAEPMPRGHVADWLPRADHLGGSWLAIREWAGRAVYRWRDG